jgi:hypothetical protein
MSRASLGDAARPNTIGANAQLLLDALDDRANALQIGIPTPAPRVIGVADDVSVLRTLAAEFTLLGHNHSILEINACGEVASVSENGPAGNTRSEKRRQRSGPCFVDILEISKVTLSGTLPTFTTNSTDFSPGAIAGSPAAVF